MGDAIFKVPTPVMLDKIVTAMDEIYEKMEQLRSEDVRGDIYEYLLSKLATAGVNGQFRTPRHIIKMMVEMMDPKADDLICDPACGMATRAIDKGMPIEQVQKLLGHQQIDTTMQYAMVNQSNVKTSHRRFIA